MKMRVDIAMNELNLLDAKISKKIRKGSFVGFATKKDDKITIDRETNNIELLNKKEAKDVYKAELQSVLDLIERRALIKSLINESNIRTKINIDGKEMTIDQALVYKRFKLEQLENLLAQMRSNYTKVLYTIEKENKKVEDDLEILLNTKFGKENKDGKRSEEDKEVIDSLTESYDKRKKEIIDFGLKEAIEQIEDEIMKFKNNVQAEINSSNAITEIEIPE